MSRRIAFTKAAIYSLKPPTQGREYLYDTKTPALALCITHTGAMSFYVYRRVNGRPERIRLGGFPEIGPEQARKLADQVNGKIAAGMNPQQAKRVGRGEMTMGELWEPVGCRRSSVTPFGRFTLGSAATAATMRPTGY